MLVQVRQSQIDAFAYRRLYLAVSQSSVEIDAGVEDCISAFSSAFARKWVELAGSTGAIPQEKGADERDDGFTWDASGPTLESRPDEGRNDNHILQLIDITGKTAAPLAAVADAQGGSRGQINERVIVSDFFLDLTKAAFSNLITTSVVPIVEACYGAEPEMMVVSTLAKLAVDAALYIAHFAELNQPRGDARCLLFKVLRMVAPGDAFTLAQAVEWYGDGQCEVKTDSRNWYCIHERVARVCSWEPDSNKIGDLLRTLLKSGHIRIGVPALQEPADGFYLTESRFARKWRIERILRGEG